MRSFFRPEAAAESPARPAPRPRSLVAAVVLTGLQGAVLLVVGVGFVLAGLLGEPSDVFDAVFIGSLSALGGAGLLLVARGLAGRRAWARSPSLVWQMILIGVGATQLRESPAMSVAFLVGGALTVAALFHPDTGAVLED